MREGRRISIRTELLIRAVAAGCALLLVMATLGGCASQRGKTASTQQSKAKPGPAIKKSAGNYRVRKGDSLYSIAWRAGLDYQTLARWNHMRHPFTIYPGQLIRLSPQKKREATYAVTPKTYKKPAPKPPVNKSSVARTTAKKSTKSVTKPTKPKKAPPVASGKLRWQWPTKGRVLSKFASADASSSGIKIGGRRGQKIVAAEAGEIVYVGSGLIGYGQLIIVKHNNKYLSAYGHNSNLLVKEGDRVKRGQHISNMGMTNQGKALLYFEVRRYGKPVNPLAYLPRG